ncbi:MAG: anthranilate synthase component I family protein [Actinomycetota bacterium]|nr:anthranilate synthase component I family protein [Actinomycetota bacterium]
MQAPFDIAADLHTPVSAYLRLAPFGPRYLLESVDGGSQGRYSFIGFGNTTSVDIDGEGVHLNGDLLSADILDGLRAALAATPVCGPAIGGQPFNGGLVGVTAFDLVRSFFRLPAAPHERSVPLGSYMATDSILIFDHLTRRMALLHSGTDADRGAVRSEVVAALRGPVETTPSPSRHSDTTASMSRDQYMAAVTQAKEYIKAGDVYQIVPSMKFAGETEIDPFLAYRALRLLNPSPYMYFLDFGHLQVVGSSPEVLVKMRDDHAELRPIAGTRPRGETEDLDLFLERELLADSKEAAEHVMLVDLARNDLGRTALAGSVQVDPYRVIERYSHVMHLVSGVSAKVRPGLDAFDLFAATFPAGTVTGAPKLAAIELIDELEPVNRDLYSGSIGYFGHGGSMDQAITIRTMIFQEGRYSYQAGAGIVADSDPSAEYEEALSKAAALRAALDLAKEGL